MFSSRFTAGLSLPAAQTSGSASCYVHLRRFRLKGNNTSRKIICPFGSSFPLDRGILAPVGHVDPRRRGCLKSSPAVCRPLTRIPHLDPADAPEGRGNAGETADSRFHPSRPSGLGHLIWRKVLAHQRKLVHEAGRTPIHLGNPGLGLQHGADGSATPAIGRLLSFPISLSSMQRNSPGILPTLILSLPRRCGRVGKVHHAALAICSQAWVGSKSRAPSGGAVHQAAVRWTVETHRGRSTENHLWAMPVVAETYDGVLNDINGFHVRSAHALAALDGAAPGPVAEGNVGGGTGMVCLRLQGRHRHVVPAVGAGRPGTSSGALVQANHGVRELADGPGRARRARLPGTGRAGRERPELGSIIIVLATDAAAAAAPAARLAKRATIGIGRGGTPGGNNSGDIFLAFTRRTRWTCRRSARRWRAEFAQRRAARPRLPGGGRGGRGGRGQRAGRRRGDAHLPTTRQGLPRHSPGYAGRVGPAHRSRSRRRRRTGERCSAATGSCTAARKARLELEHRSSVCVTGQALGRPQNPGARFLSDAPARRDGIVERGADLSQAVERPPPRPKPTCGVDHSKGVRPADTFATCRHLISAAAHHRFRAKAFAWREAADLRHGRARRLTPTAAAPPT